MMRAVVHDAYGSPERARLEDVPAPVPRAGEVLVEVHATTVNRTDCGFRQGKPFFVRLFSGLVRPKYRILGTEFAGVVVEVGPGVGRFQSATASSASTPIASAPTPSCCAWPSLPRLRGCRPG